jgi:predicted HD phosphohydrolase
MESSDATTFTRMETGSAEEFGLIAAATFDDQNNVAGRVLHMLRSLRDLRFGFGVDQLHHALQIASMARRANASDEIVLCALCHDMGKFVSALNHGQVAAEILKPYVSSDAYHIVRTHQDFQGRHFYAHFGLDPNLREQYRSEAWFGLAEQFTDEWDQAAFDPAYPVLPLEEFEPLIKQYFSQFLVSVV